MLGSDAAGIPALSSGPATETQLSSSLAQRNLSTVVPLQPLVVSGLAFEKAAAGERAGGEPSLAECAPSGLPLELSAPPVARP